MTATHGGLSDDQVERFARNGFLNAGPVLAEAELAELSAELDRVLALGPDGFTGDQARPVLFRDLTAGAYGSGDAGGTGPNPVWQIVNMWEASTAFERLLHHPFIVRAISRLTGFADLQVWHDQVQYKPAGTGGATGWHQDAPKWPTIEPMTPVSAWIPFDDADEANGCMWMVPGSHAWGDVDAYLGQFGDLTDLGRFDAVGRDFTPPADAPIRAVKAVPCPVRRGEVHFHHSLTWHGSPTNRSDRPRRAIAIHYMTSEARYTGRRHVMQRFITLETGEPMGKAGPHFPVVCRGGEPVGATHGGSCPAPAS